MRFITVKRMLKNSELTDKGIESVYEYMLGTPDSDYKKPMVKRRWLVAIKRAFTMEAINRTPLSKDQVQFILNQKQVNNGR